MAELTAELGGAGPMHDAREHADEDDADDDADQADAGEIPFAVLFHLGYLLGFPVGRPVSRLGFGPDAVRENAGRGTPPALCNLIGESVKKGNAPLTSVNVREDFTLNGPGS